MHTSVVKQQLLSLAHEAIKEADRERLESYVTAYSREIPVEVLGRVKPHRLLAFVIDRFAFLEESFGPEVKVVIRDPENTLLDGEASSTVIETRLPDCAFIVRTIRSFLREKGLQLQFVLHPIHGVMHDRGRITGVDATQGAPYSQVYLQVSAIPEARRESLRLDLQRRLELAVLINRDRAAMTARFRETANTLSALTSGPNVVEAQEARELIEWLEDDNFIFIGYGSFAHGLSTLPGSSSTPPAAHGLGLFAAPDDHLAEVIGEIVATRHTRPELYSFYRTDFVTVVRSVAQVRYFGVTQFDPSGNSLGEHVFLGLLSTKAVKQANRRVPVVRRRIEHVMAKLEDRPGSYSYTKSRAILDSIPVEDLFYWNVDEIYEVANLLRQAESKDEAGVFAKRRPGGRRITIICIVPRMRFSEVLREELAREIRTFLAIPHLREYHRETDDESPIRLHFTVGKYRSAVTDSDLEILSERLERLLESWEDRLRDLVFKRFRTRGEMTSRSKYLTTTSAAQIWERYGSRFPDSYKAVLLPEIALLDIELIEKLDETDRLRAAIVVLGKKPSRHTSLRIVSHDELLLNDVVPVLDRMALRTTSRLGERLLPGLGPDIYITGFEVTGADGHKVEDEATLERLGTIVQRVLSGHLVDDRLLGLGYLAGLDWKQIDLLITYRNYFLQVFQGFGAHTVNGVLLKHPACAAVLFDYFQTKFAVDRYGPPTERAANLLPSIARRYEQLLLGVEVIQEDVVLRYLFDLLDATVRTNYYRAGRGDVISIKIESARVDHMPRPCPLYEIYVHALGVEGIHLRDGKVARGGIRHSDRADDLRTEILGLQRTQTLKNTVIVPLGSKGGFVMRDHTVSRDDVRRQYEVFISGLLDLTDNYNGTTVVPPPDVVRYDVDDPYLVVAADKGTAHLSDTANAISARYGFWLDDAFASGGSTGYDHKAIGITSRGAWTNVERHFRELGIDLHKASIRVAGVGDMSGDVFGNGMLLNDQIRLVAAFDHRHVFVDPSPDPATSYAERNRLFQMPTSQWSDYARAAMGKGGDVFERAAKEITLSLEARTLLGLRAKTVTGPDVVRAILALDVDLLWFGGIGTYVKATAESHGDVGDKVNDPVRINASELRARVIGEGANLAITQRARTEYALHGGRCNTDAIDNSAGVDCSDHEVNLKILLAPLLAANQLTRAARDELLRSLQPEVATACIRDNYLQGALLSMEAMRSRRQGESFLALLTYLEKRGLDRVAEHVPSDHELRGWLASGQGLPRNLLAILVAHAKNDLYRQVLESPIPDLALFQPFLASYFPSTVAERFPTQVTKHHLGREITATVVVNALINQAGSTLLVELRKETTASIEDLIVRYFVCDELLEGRTIREAVHGADKIAASDQYTALLAFEDVHRSLLRWWIWNEASWKLENVAKTKPVFDAAVAALVAELDPPRRLVYDAHIEDLARRGFEIEVATTLAGASFVRSGFALLATSQDASIPLATAARLFHQVGRDLHVDVLDQIIAAQLPSNTSERRFARSLEREAAHVRRRAAFELARDPEFVSRNAEPIARLGDALCVAKQLGVATLIPLSLILSDYRALS